MSPKLIDMALDEEERAESATPVPSAPGKKPKPKGPEYPYGLLLNLDNSTLDKLGIDLDDYEQGEEVTLTARVKVSGMSTRMSEGEDEPRRTLDLQITHLGLGASSEEEEEELEEGHDGEDELPWTGKKEFEIDSILKKKGY